MASHRSPASSWHRCGDIDPAIVLNVMDNHNLSTKEMDTLMNKKSGVLGISGVSSDFRDLGQAAAEGNERAQLALDMFHYQVRKEIGAFAAAMGGVDVITFTAGVGENGIEDRAAIAEGLEYLGAKLDPQRNNVRGKDASSARMIRRSRCTSSRRTKNHDRPRYEGHRIQTV